MKNIYNFIEKKISWICTAHDMYHIERVCKLWKIIQESEGNWDKDVIIASSLLHEVFDNKFFSDNFEEQDLKLQDILKKSWLNKLQQEKVMFIIKNIWYWKSLWRREKPEMIEFQIVEDADRLESIWAISIARTFSYGWRKWIPIYDPKIPFEVDMTEEKYWNSSTSINHFYEKLLKLKDKMNTKKWKEIAEKKHKFLEIFLQEFYKEWEVNY